MQEFKSTDYETDALAENMLTNVAHFPLYLQKIVNRMQEKGLLCYLEKSSALLQSLKESDLTLIDKKTLGIEIKKMRDSEKTIANTKFEKPKLPKSYTLDDLSIMVSKDMEIAKFLSSQYSTQKKEYDEQITERKQTERTTGTILRTIGNNIYPVGI